MQQLISITTDEQGSSVVSARELHAFLEVKSKFADWIKNRIIKYQFREDEDYVIVEGFSKNLEKPLSDDSGEVLLKNEKNPSGGRPETDYALTLDMAKQLSMVENNQKGKEARQYFINAEKAARALAAAPPAPAPSIAPAATEQMMLQLMQQQSQLMAGQQLMLEQLRADVETIRHTGQRPPSRAKRLPAPVQPPHLSSNAPAPSLRQQVSRKVNDYCAYHSAQQTEAYNYLYKRMMEVYGVNVYRLIRMGRESILDAIERYGHLDRLYSLVMAELSYSDD